MRYFILLLLISGGAAAQTPQGCQRDLPTDRADQVVCDPPGVTVNTAPAAKSLRLHARAAQGDKRAADWIAKHPS